ncbi:GUN4 domain-containing protein [Martelella endophytica]|uniref:GUN4-like domain-containing protein n=1 Tax=Martelella endophytica TaxID=1486262 RepID=A0A0D5LNI1_MAREN|nr:GUN4 domain-containing protein [Martelella endophytica]AJY45794.1 hypothetical protein TM49_08980 [Martelella endophytica]
MKNLLKNKTFALAGGAFLIVVISALTFLDGRGAYNPATRYGRMRDELAAGDFKAANTEASEIVLQLANRTNEGWLGTDDVERLPCADLVYMDALFMNASGGRFGLSAQEKVLATLDEKGETTLSRTPDRLDAFGSAVGWRRDGRWLTYDEMSFAPADAPVGHLPVFKPEDGIRAPFKSRDGHPQTGGALFDLLEHRFTACRPEILAAN